MDVKSQYFTEFLSFPMSLEYFSLLGRLKRNRCGVTGYNPGKVS